MAPDYRRATRPSDRRLIGGVATGLADHLMVPVLYVRIGFVVATWLSGTGVIAYLVLWRLLPLNTPDAAPGLASATRRGLRQDMGPKAREIAQAVALVAVGLGVLLMIQGTGRGVSGTLLVPLLLGVLGVAVVWRQLDNAALSRWVRGTSGWAMTSRLAVGVVLVGLAGLYVASQTGGWDVVVNVGAALLLALLGIGLLVGPWALAQARDLSAERRERVRAQEREDMAAHLHDSVLQTLALLQKNAGDARAVAAIARRQERELRSWLYGRDDEHADTLVAGLQRVAADVEQDHQIAVEVVTVGDLAADGDVTALVRATREAVVNAAKHAGVDRVDVYAEVGEKTAEVFVRDRGVGFDPQAIAADRMGVRNSVIARLERHGGSATIRSAPGQGTEVRMAVGVRTHEQEEA